MNSRGRLNEWLNEFRHPSDEMLMAYLDGELSARAASSTHRHLDRCWACRQRADRARRTMGVFVDFQQSRYALDENQPPHRWTRFPFLLAAARQREETRPAEAPWRWGLHGIAAVLAVLLVCFLIWERLRSPEPVSAKELLARMEEVELRAGPGAGRPVLRQKLRIVGRTAAGAPLSSELELWQDLTSGALRFSPLGAGAEQGIEPLRRFLEREIRLFSAAAFNDWRESLAGREESVQPVILPGGEPGYRIEVRTLAAKWGDGILESALLVRADRWTPVSQSLKLRFGGRIFEYELLRDSFAYVSSLRKEDVASRMNRERSAEEPHSGSSPAAPEPPRASQSPVRIRAAETAEVEAHFALHRLDACLDEALEVAAEGSSIVIRGLVSTAERKQQIGAAAGRIKNVELRIRTVEEALSDVVSNGAARNPVAEIAEQVSSAPMPLYRRLGPGKNASKEEAEKMVATANSAVSASSTVLSHAWAIQRLADRFDERQVSKMEPAASWLIETMARSHLARLREEHDRLRELLGPVIGLASPEALFAGQDTAASIDWRSSAAILLSGSREADRLIRVLFASSSRDQEPVETSLARLRGSLDASRAQFNLLASGMEAEFSGMLAGAGSGRSRRNEAPKNRESQVER